ncbi:unnamed protein product [Ilex paraguariensis]|uniref:Uncharacterized protein n=1 Tax=Ilex paraguariensis TaxID=185542 RepID=A0ABC8T4L5_9AQUA
MEFPMTNSFSVNKPALFFKPSNLSLLNQHSLLSLSLLPSHFLQTHMKKPIICSRNNRRGSDSQRSRKLVLNAVHFIASKLNVLPEPLDMMIREFGGGNGGGFGFRKSFGWSGFDGWGRKKKKRLEFMEFVLLCGLGLWLILGKEIDGTVFLGVLSLILFGVSLNGSKGAVNHWTSGFFCCAICVGLGLKGQDLKTWVKAFRHREIARRGIRRRRAM